MPDALMCQHERPPGFGSLSEWLERYTALPSAAAIDVEARPAALGISATVAEIPQGGAPAGPDWIDALYRDYLPKL